MKPTEDYIANKVKAKNIKKTDKTFVFFNVYYEFASFDISIDYGAFIAP